MVQKTFCRTLYRSFPEQEVSAFLYIRLYFPFKYPIPLSIPILQYPISNQSLPSQLQNDSTFHKSRLYHNRQQPRRLYSCLSTGRRQPTTPTSTGRTRQYCSHTWITGLATSVPGKRFPGARLSIMVPGFVDLRLISIAGVSWWAKKAGDMQVCCRISRVRRSLFK